MENLHVVSGWSERKKLVRTPSVIISPAGMLMGGASVFYNQALSQDQRNGISIVSFPDSGQPREDSPRPRDDVDEWKARAGQGRSEAF